MRVQASGDGDMADLADRFSVGRFRFCKPYILRNLIINVRPLDSLLATVGVGDVHIFRQNFPVYPAGVEDLWHERNIGVGDGATAMNHSVPRGDAREFDWIFGPKGDLVVTWVNPEPGDLGWEMIAILEEYRGQV